MKTNILILITILVSASALYLFQKRTTTKVAQVSGKTSASALATDPVCKYKNWLELSKHFTDLIEKKGTLSKVDFISQVQSAKTFEDCSDFRVFIRDFEENLEKVTAENQIEADYWLDVLFEMRELTDGAVKLGLDEKLGDLLAQSPKKFLALYDQKYHPKVCDSTLVAHTGTFGEDPQTEQKKLSERKKALMAVNEPSLETLKDSCLDQIQQSLRFSQGVKGS